MIDRNELNKKIESLCVPVMIPNKKGRSVILAITPANFNSLRIGSGDTVLTSVSVPTHFSDYLVQAYLNPIYLKHFKRSYHRKTALIVFSFNKETITYSNCGLLTLHTINYADYLQFLDLYKQVLQQVKVSNDDVIVIFEELQWSHVYHLLNKIGLRASGGSHTKRHLLSLIHYRLLEFLKSTCTLHEYMQIESERAPSEEYDFSNIKKLLIESFYGEDNTKDKLLNKKYRLFTEINKTFLKNFKQDTGKINADLFNTKLLAIKLFYDALLFEINENGLTITIEDDFKKAYHKLLRQFISKNNV